ncbi:hypothetical protein [Dongia sedimenti]|uniref:Uncharacterized protein n=1 Tax=Dongia sedimenti TaxID=3064282 RepID=A0ABU0YFW5_9PROT|nr:hypothetical protein [Rhodospirillaceae bacterium R-7]
MHSATEKIDATRDTIAQTEQRILRQRRRVEKMLIERHPADEAQAQLLIMEQSLISMTRFLKNLERDLELDALRGDLASKRSRPARSKPDGRAVSQAGSRPPE